MKYIKPYENFKDYHKNIDDILLIMFRFEKDMRNEKDLYFKYDELLRFYIFNQCFKYFSHRDREVLDYLKNIDNNKKLIYLFQSKKLYDNTEDNTKIWNEINKELDNHKLNNIILRTNDFFASKENMHKLFHDKDYFIKAVYSKDDVKEFPVVAKKDFGHSGQGIKKINSLEELQKDTNEYDMYTEYIDYKREFRYICFMDQIVALYERIPCERFNIDINTKDYETEMKFLYIESNIEKFPYQYSANIIKNDIYNRVVNSDHQPYIWAMDFFIDKNDQIKIIELNDQPGSNPCTIRHYFYLFYKLLNKTPKLSKLNIIEKSYREWNFLLADNNPNELAKALCPVITPSNLYGESDIKFLQEVDRYYEENINKYWEHGKK